MDTADFIRHSYPATAASPQLHAGGPANCQPTDGSDSARVRGAVRLAQELSRILGGGEDFYAALALAVRVHGELFTPRPAGGGRWCLDAAVSLAAGGAPSDVIDAILLQSERRAELATCPEAAPLSQRLEGLGATPLADALTFCEMRTAATGELATFPERALEVLRSEAGTALPPHLQESRAACVRVLDRIAARAPSPLPWLFLDVDDTLVPLGARLSERNRKTLGSYAAAGGRVSLATGKHPWAIGGLLRELDLGGGHVAGNGTVVLLGGHPTLLAPVHGHAKELGQALSRRRVPYVTFSLDGVFVESDDVNERHLALLASLNEPRPVWGPPQDGRTIFKLVAFVDSDRAELEASLRDEAQGLDLACVRTSNRFLDFIGPGSGKGDGMEYLLRESGWPVLHTVGLGDNENDIPMFRRAGLAVAVANGSAAARAAADHIVGECQADGVAEYVEGLLERG